MPCSDKTFEGSLQYFFVSTAYVYCLLPELNSKLKAPVQKSILFGITAGDFTLPWQQFKENALMSVECFLKNETPRI